MKLTESVFGKRIDEISLDDLKKFFLTEKEESSKIEFKSGEIKIEDIYREICAFLNTDGGLLIIGSPREQKISINKKNQKRICKGDLIPSTFQNKGWLIQKIATNISPFPTNIDIQEILTPEGNYFIMEIPQSLTPPHQCLNEGKYYIRLEDEAKPAPHGIIQSLFFRRQQPTIRTDVNLCTYKDRAKNEIEISINIKNDSKIPTDNISFLVTLKNIEEIKVEDYHENSHGFSEKRNKSFMLQNSLNQVLVEKLNIPVEFIIVHNFQPFIIGIMVWGKDFGLYENCCIWNPIEFKKVKGFKTGDNNKNMDYQDLVIELDEILKNENIIN